jgi:hypothetical protein
VSDELTLSVSLGYAKNAISLQEQVANFLASVAGNGLNSLISYAAPTADTALPLGSVTSPGGWLFVVNLDATNYVQVKAAVSGAVLAKLKPGYPCLIPLDPSVTAPSTQSNTAPCNIRYCIFDA